MYTVNTPHPTYTSYWIIPGRLAGGEYPWAENDDDQLDMLLRQMVEAGLTFFLDLTEVGERDLAPYDTALKKAGMELGVSVVFKKMPIHDHHATSISNMRRIIETMDKALEDNHTIYLHCFAGCGRTGMTACCYLVHLGMGGEEALRRLDDCRKGTIFGGVDAPSGNQRDMVLNWQALM